MAKLPLTLNDLDREAARKFAEQYTAIEVGGLFIDVSPEKSGVYQYFGLENESDKPDRFFMATEGQMKWFQDVYGLEGAIFFHSHPRGGLVSEIDFQMMVLFKDWFGIERGLVYALEKEDAPAAWYMYNETAVIEGVYENV